jgi:hypothetical protein
MDKKNQNYMIQDKEKMIKLCNFIILEINILLYLN